MPSVLLINPNTSTAVTHLLESVVRPLLDPAIELVAVSARFGASYIASEAAYAIAAHAALDAWAMHRAEGGRCDLVLVGCFGDPGVAALRELSGVPVVGLAEAALREAATHGPHAIVTGGAAWRPMLARFAAANRLDRDLREIRVIPRSGAEMMADPDTADRELLSALQATADAGARAVVLGGAALGGFAARIASGVPIPVIDSVQAGARAAMSALRSPTGAAPSIDRGVSWAGLTPALEAALSRPT
jgi:Asp/Glu/hydantoin racemase